MNNFIDLCLFEDKKPYPLVEPEIWELVSSRFNAFQNNGLSEVKPIPKIIHQIWIGSPVPDVYKTFINSWKLHNPDWEYILWDDKKIKQLNLKNKKAFNLSPSFGIKSDIARYEILYRFGGIYVDTDFECLKDFTPITSNCSFFAGHSNGLKINILNGIIGSSPYNTFFEELLDKTKEPLFSNDGMKVINYSGPGLFTSLFMAHLTSNENAVLFPSVYFYPYPNYDLSKNLPLEAIKKTYIQSESYAIHYWEASWLKNTFKNKVKKYIKTILRKF
jgi:mannosyltransferase OCH1-like enzyme